MHQNYALIIGVHDYRTYDPSGDENVPGARHDACAWYRACLSMGFSPENLRVLASPPLSPAELGPGAAKATLGEATRAGIIEGLTWLSERIGGDVPASGLMTFSGHGDEGEAGDPVLCPSDTTASLEEVIDVAALRQKASAKVKDNFTMMLDCCHAQVGASAAESMQGRLRAKRAGVQAPEAARARARVVAACRRDQQSVSARFLGEEMGAFTWAVASAVGQWKTVVEDGVARLDVSYGNLVVRARALLSALSFEQEPVLSGPEGVADLAFLHPGTAGERGETAPAPTAERKGHQLDGGQLPAGHYLQYAVLLAGPDGVFLGVAEIFVTASDMGEDPPKIGSTPMESSTEYWVFSGGVISSLERDYAGSLYLQMPALNQSADEDVTVPNGALCFTANELVSSWTQVGETQWPGKAYTFTETNGTIRGAALQYEGNTPTAWWWVQTGQNNLTPDQMSAAMLYPNKNRLSSSDYYAASAFIPFDPDRSP